MSFFKNRNVDDIPDNPNELPNNTYKLQVTSAILAKTKEKTDRNGNPVPVKEGITFKYQIIEGAWSTFFPLTDWVQIPDENTPDDKVDRMLSFLKMRLLGFGFTPDWIQDFGPEQVEETLNKVFYGTTYCKKENGNTQIRVQKFDPFDEYADNGSDDDWPSV